MAWKPQHFLLIVIDAGLLSIAWTLAYVITFADIGGIPTADGIHGEDYFLQFQLLLPWIVVTHVAIYWLFSVYRGMIRYTSIVELKTLLAANATFLAVWVAINFWFSTLESLPPLPIREIGNTGEFELIRIPWPVLILYMAFGVGMTAGFRLSHRLWKDTAAHSQRERSEAPRTLIVGGGDTADSLLRNLRREGSMEFRPVCAVATHANRVGLRLHGVPVVGTIEKIPEVLKTEQIERVLIALEDTDPEILRRVVQACENRQVSFRMIPSIADISEGRVSVSQEREVRVEDLLGRDPVNLQLPEDQNYLAKERILITGAGGSIGSELSRQCAAAGAGELVLLGKGENSIFTICEEIRRSYPNVRTIPVIADIRDWQRVQSVFQKHRPAVIFHAAAHKHVPLMEDAPEEAIKNNVLGSWNVMRAAQQSLAKRFVLISSDKAVEPSSVMGATKRMAEYMAAALAREGKCRYQTVRFGNVMGSRGSVIPLFQSQIRAGGPVTITHPDIARYFMTIPEAVNLVLQAGSLEGNGSVYVLDMGKPVKIIELARSLAALSGLTLGKDIAIEYVGLRPGEKLHEKLVTIYEQSEATPIPKITRAIADPLYDEDAVSAMVEGMLAAAEAAKRDEIYQQLAAAIPDYHPAGSEPGHSYAPAAPQSFALASAPTAPIPQSESPSAPEPEFAPELPEPEPEPQLESEPEAFGAWDEGEAAQDSPLPEPEPEPELEAEPERQSEPEPEPEQELESQPLDPELEAEPEFEPEPKLEQEAANLEPEMDSEAGAEPEEFDPEEELIATAPGPAPSQSHMEEPEFPGMEEIEASTASDSAPSFVENEEKLAHEESLEGQDLAESEKSFRSGPGISSTPEKEPEEVTPSTPPGAEYVSGSGEPDLFDQIPSDEDEEKETDTIMSSELTSTGACLLLRTAKGADRSTLELFIRQMQENVLSEGDTLVLTGEKELIEGFDVPSIATGEMAEGAIANKALEHAPDAGIFITLSSDALITADTLSAFRKALTPADAVLAYSDFKEDRDGEVEEVKLHDHNGCPHERFEFGPVIAYRIDKIKQVGGIRGDLNLAWEYDIHLKLMELSPFTHITDFTYTRFVPVTVDSTGKKVFSPGMGPLGGFSYVFYPDDVEREVTSVFEDALKRRGCWIDHPTAEVDHSGREYEVLASVVIPILNRKRFIGNAIEKVLSGTFQDFEIVIVDNGSTDGTVEEVEKYAEKDSRVRLIHGTGGSIASALNEGIKAARGKYICQLDSDDEYAPTTLEEMVGHLESHPKCGLAISYYRLMDEDCNIIEEVAPITHGGYSRNQIIRRDGAGALRVFPKVVLEEFGYYDEEHYGNFGEDYDMVVKTGEKYDVDRVHKVLYHYRRHADNTDVTRDPAMKYNNKNRARQEALRRRREINEKLGKV